MQNYDAVRVNALRQHLHLHLHPVVLASALNAGVSTVREWEVGDKPPRGPLQKLLDILERKELEAAL